MNTMNMVLPRWDYNSRKGVLRPMINADHVCYIDRSGQILCVWCAQEREDRQNLYGDLKAEKEISGFKINLTDRLLFCSCGIGIEASIELDEWIEREERKKQLKVLPRHVFSYLRNGIFRGKLMAEHDGFSVYYISISHACLCAECASYLERRWVDNGLDKDEALSLQAKINWENPDLHCAFEDCNSEKVKSQYGLDVYPEKDYDEDA